MTAKSRVLSAAALIIVLGWVASLAWYFTAFHVGLTWGYAVIAYLQAAAFWRLSKRSYIAKPLFVLQGLYLPLHLFGTLDALADWWVSFSVNRLFDATLLYLMACAIYRIWKRRGVRRLQKSAKIVQSDLLHTAYG